MKISWRKFTAAVRKKSGEQERLEAYVQKEDVTLDGDRIPLLANIGELFELEAARHSRAAGIGLFRSECLYMERETYPSEEEQFQILPSDCTGKCRASRW